VVDERIIRVLERMLNTAQMHGTSFCKVAYDPQTDEFLFNVILPEHIIVKYGKQDG